MRSAGLTSVRPSTKIAQESAAYGPAPWLAGPQPHR